MCVLYQVLNEEGKQPQTVWFLTSVMETRAPERGLEMERVVNKAHWLVKKQPSQLILKIALHSVKTTDLNHLIHCKPKHENCWLLTVVSHIFIRT